MLVNKKAVSTIILIILILCSAVFGAFLSYMWVMANFYLEPENVNLVITQVDFPVDHADYFYITVMNPSHSPSKTNITEIYFSVEGNDKVYNVTDTYPEALPIPLEKGTNKTIKCNRNWGEFAGKIITVHVSGVNASGAARSVRTEFVKLEVQAYFNATESCKYFNITVFNSDGSAINLTLTKVYFDYELVENMSIQIPPSGLMIPTNGTIDFQCFVDWQGHGKPLVHVKTLEGYTAEISKEVSSVVILPITDVMFNETDPNDISITLFNGEESATPVDVTNVTLTDDNGTEYVVRLFDPPLRIENNETVTFNCVWNWTNYRDRNVTITAYTKQGFTSSPKTVETPQPIIFKITELRFNLTNTGFFLVNVTNMPCSLQDINITKIQFNETETSFESQIIPIGEERQFNCTFDWKDFRGGNVNITVYTADGLNISEGITLPSVDLKILEEHDFAKSTEGILYVNVTIFNTVFSAQNVTITHIIFETENTTDVIDGKLTNPKLVPEGYVLIVDANVTIVCPWNWTLYPNQDVTITVQAAEGFSISQTFQIPESTS
jgi:hypothetical protein